jgi:hypothetical protein
VEYIKTRNQHRHRSGAEAARLEGHSGLVSALCALTDGRLASGSYDNTTIRLWDVALQREISCREVDAPLHCLAALGSMAAVSLQVASLQATDSGDCTGCKWCLTHDTERYHA